MVVLFLISLANIEQVNRATEAVYHIETCEEQVLLFKAPTPPQLLMRLGGLATLPIVAF